MTDFKGLVKCTKAQYEALAAKDPDKVYIVSDDDTDWLTQDIADALYQAKLTAGANITIVDNVISASGGGGESWTELAQSEWSSHVFNVGDRLRLTCATYYTCTLSRPPADWTTAIDSTSGLSMAATHMGKVVEFVRTTTASMYVPIGTNCYNSSGKYISICNTSINLTNAGNLKYIRNGAAFNGVSTKTFPDTVLSLTTGLKKVEYIPASV